MRQHADRRAADWRGLMELTRQVAEQLSDDGLLDIMQKGAVITSRLSAVKGPIRLRMRPPASSQGDQSAA